MPKGQSPVNAILSRIRKVTQRTTDTLKRELAYLEAQKSKLTAHLDDAAERIRKTLGDLGHSSNGEHAAPPLRRAKRKRIRRSPEQLKHEAAAIIQFVRSKGSEGAKGGEIREHHPKVGPDIKGFVQKHAGRKLKTTGQKASMRYFAG